MPAGGNPIRIPALLTLLSIGLLTGAALPLDVPVPEQRPDAAAKTEDKAAPPEAEDETPAVTDQKKVTEPKSDQVQEPETKAEPAPPVEAEDPAAYAACTAALKTLGVTFREAERIDDGEGCGIDRPIVVETLGADIKLSPPGTMRCQAAAGLARWTQDVVVPMLAKAQPQEKILELNQASAYICRKRNGASTGKISEHARGTAIDIASFTFWSGKTFTIAPREEEPTLNGAFQRSIASAACLYFSTVLDPGSDAAHETHLHLDTLKRKGGYRYCW